MFLLQINEKLQLGTPKSRPTNVAAYMDEDLFTVDALMLIVFVWRVLYAPLRWLVRFL